MVYLKCKAKFLLQALVMKRSRHCSITSIVRQVRLPDMTVENVIEEVTKDEMLKKGNNILCTDQLRKSFCKNNLTYVEPLPLYLAQMTWGINALHSMWQ